MKKTAEQKNNRFIQWMLLGIPCLFIVATPLHFLFEWTGESSVIAPFVPVNESVWEHLKLVFWPALFWWGAGYLLFLKNDRGGFFRAAVTGTVVVVFAALFITGFFYTFKGAFGIESLALDILALFLSLLCGILLARHVYVHTKPGGLVAFICVFILLLMAAAFIYFTFVPPHLPLFLDTSTGTYGIAP